MGGGPKCPSVVPFEIPDSEGPFEVASFEHFDWEWHFNFHSEVPFGGRYIPFGTHRSFCRITLMNQSWDKRLSLFFFSELKINNATSVSWLAYKTNDLN